MHLNIKSDETYELAAAAAKLTGQSLTQTVKDALNEYLGRIQETKKKERKEELPYKLERLAQKYQKLPILDPRDHGEILYDKDGFPKLRSEI